MKLGFTIIVALISTKVVLSAEKLIGPEPVLERPIEELLFCHEYEMPGIPGLEAKFKESVLPAHMEVSGTGESCGIGLTIIANSSEVPTQR